MPGIDTKSIYVTQFSNEKVYWICRSTESNFGISLLSVEKKEDAESLGREFARVLDVKFYASKPLDLWSEVKVKEASRAFIKFQVKETLSDECGIYGVIQEEDPERRYLLFASVDPSEICKYASEIAKLLGIPVVVDPSIQYYKRKDISSGGKKKMAESKKTNKMQLCRDLIAQGVPDEEIIKKLTEVNIADGKNPEFAAKRAKVVFKYLKRKVKGETTTKTKKEAPTPKVSEQTEEVSDSVVESTEETIQETEE